MFWRAVPGAAIQGSAVDAVLDREAFTLADLLDEEDLVQEARALNGRLVDYLRGPDVVRQLLEYAVGPPPEDADRKARFKYPFAACEVLCCEVDAITATLLDTPGLLATLFSVLDAPPPLECVRAGYFARLAARLLARRTEGVMAFLRENPSTLARLVAHVDTASVAEVVARLLGADDAMGLPPAQLAWLRGAGVLSGLLDCLAPSAPPDAQKHAAAVLAAVVRAHASPLLPAFADPEFLDALLDRALAPRPDGAAAAPENGAATTTPPPPHPPSVQALEVCIALLEPKDPPADPHLLSPAAAAAAAEVDIATKDAAVAGVAPRLSQLAALLDAGPRGGVLSTTPAEGGEEPSSTPRPPQHAEGEQLTPYGVLAPPLGLTRIKAVALLVALLRSGRAAAVAGVVRSGAIARCLALFERYPFNNLLHHHVTALLLAALDVAMACEEEDEEEGEEGAEGEGEGGAADGPPSRTSPRGADADPGSPAGLLHHVLHVAALPRWLARLPVEVRPIPLPGDARAAERPPLRAGYLGHVTHLGNRLLALAAGSRAVADALAGDPDWAAWADGDLRARTELDDPDAWECGRPAPTAFPALGLGMRADGFDAWGRDDDDEDEEEEGGGGAARRGLASPPPADEDEGSGGGGGGAGPAGSPLDLQQLAEAAASINAMRISGSIPSLSSSSGGEDEDGSSSGGSSSSSSTSTSSSSSSSDDEEEEEGGTKAAAAASAAAAAPSPDPSSAAWDAFPESHPPDTSLGGLSSDDSGTGIAAAAAAAPVQPAPTVPTAPRVGSGSPPPSPAISIPAAGREEGAVSADTPAAAAVPLRPPPTLDGSPADATP